MPKISKNASSLTVVPFVHQKHNESIYPQQPPFSGFNLISVSNYYYVEDTRETKKPVLVGALWGKRN